MKRQKDVTLKDELLRWVGAQYATEEQKNSSRRNEEAEPKQKQHPIVDVSGGESGHPCLVPDFRGNAFNFSPLRIMFAVGLSYIADIPGSCAILLFTALDLASITSHVHNWVLILLWLHPFILSGVISPLISSSILGTY